MPDEPELPFRYETFPQGSGFSMRPVLRDGLSEDEFLDRLATRAGCPRATAEAVLRAAFALVVESVRQSVPVDFVLRLFRIQPTGGGRFPVPDPAAPLVRDHLGLRVVLHRDVERVVQADCPLESAGSTGTRTPQVHSVLGRPGAVQNAYGTAVGTIVDGEDFRDAGESAVEPKADLIPVGGGPGTPILLPVIQSSPTKLVLGAPPAGTTGPKLLRISAGYSAAFTVYDKPLLPV